MYHTSLNAACYAAFLNAFELLLLKTRQQCRATVETFLGPELGGLVILGHGGRTGREHDPRLLRCCENMDVGWGAVRVIERADSDEANGVAATGVVAPNGDIAPGAAGNPLTLAAVGRRVDDLDFPLQQLHAVGFDQRVEREGGSSLSLTPAAVATVNEEGSGCHAVAHEATCATTVAKCSVSAHRWTLTTNLTLPFRGAEREGLTEKCAALLGVGCNSLLNAHFSRYPSTLMPTTLIGSAKHSQPRIDRTTRGTRLNRMIPILKTLMPA